MVQWLGIRYNTGDTGSIPGPGTPYMWGVSGGSLAEAPQLLSLCSGAQQPQLLRLGAATTEALAP